LAGGSTVDLSANFSSAKTVLATQLRTSLVAAAVFFLGAAAASATPVTVTGSYSIGQTGTAALSNALATPFTLSLNVGVPSTATNFFRETQSASQTDTITANFTFTLPSSGNGSISAAEEFDVTGNARHDTLTWNNGGVSVITFADGAILDITLSNQTFNGVRSAYDGLTPTITFDLVAGPTTAVPEPTTLSLLGVLLVGLGFARRRKAA
jgi:hypothetical protein